MSRWVVQSRAAPDERASAHPGSAVGSWQAQPVIGVAIEIFYTCAVTFSYLLRLTGK